MISGTPTNRRGDIGLALAMLYYTQLGYVPSLPLNDQQPYDLIVALPGAGLQRVQIKTVEAKRGDAWHVELRSTSGPFDSNLIDRLFVATDDGSLYDIELGEEFPSTALNLGGPRSAYFPDAKVSLELVSW